MIDRTQEDINQDQRIGELEQTVKDLREALRATRDGQAAHDITLRSHQSQLAVLEPLVGILEHVAAIKSFFDNWKRGFPK